jgi:hypothetical protein
MPFCRKKHCKELLGEGEVALHAAALPQELQDSPAYWRRLYSHVLELQAVRWWRSGARQVKRDVNKVG